MTRETYLKLTGFVRKDEKKIRLLAAGNRICTGMVFFAYPVFLLYLLLVRDVFFWRALCVPAVSFAVVTIVRKCINAPRPYEKFGIPPVLKKETRGNSFPSRHVFSAFMIAVTIGYCFPPAGILLSLVGAAIAVMRVVGGVHEIKDVTAGAFAAVICGLLCYSLL